MDKTDKLAALLPCPFCQQEVRATQIEGAGYSLVGCGDLNCPASSVSCYPDEWNTRAPSPVAAPVDAEGSMTSEQLERAALVAESHGIDLETAQELIYLRDIRAIANNLIAAPSDSSIRAANDLCFPKPCVHCNQIDCECETGIAK